MENTENTISNESLMNFYGIIDSDNDNNITLQEFIETINNSFLPRIAEKFEIQNIINIDEQHFNDYNFQDIFYPPEKEYYNIINFRKLIRIVLNFIIENNNNFFISGIQMYDIPQYYFYFDNIRHPLPLSEKHLLLWFSIYFSNEYGSERQSPKIRLSRASFELDALEQFLIKASNGNDHATLDQIVELFNKEYINGLGTNITIDQIKIYDKNNDGKLDFDEFFSCLDEFIIYISRSYKNSDTSLILHSLWGDVDKNNIYQIVEYFSNKFTVIFHPDKYKDQVAYQTSYRFDDKKQPVEQASIARHSIQRQISDYNTDQGELGTCYAHVSARLFARVIKLKFDGIFIQKEECNDYYDTRYLDNSQDSIFDKFIDTKNIQGRYGLLCCKDYDSDGWCEENLSAMLFHYIYKIIKNNYGCQGGKFDEVISFYFRHFRTNNITIDSIKQILGYNQYKYDDNNNKVYFEDKISLLTDILNQVTESITNDEYGQEQMILEFGINENNYNIDNPQYTLEEILQGNNSYGIAAINNHNILDNNISEILRFGFKLKYVTETYINNSFFSSLIKNYKEKNNNKDDKDYDIIDLLKNYFNHGLYAYASLQDLNIERFPSHGVLFTGLEKTEDDVIFNMKNSWGENWTYMPENPINNHLHYILRDNKSCSLKEMWNNRILLRITLISDIETNSGIEHGGFRSSKNKKNKKTKKNKKNKKTKKTKKNI
jgi:Ca2+-binding EF-hand superfamily protein